MPGPAVEQVQNARGARVLNFGALRIHNVHLQSGRTDSRGCRVCSEGLASVLAKVEDGGSREPPVAESGGTDEEETAPPPSSDGTSEREDTLLW